MSDLPMQQVDHPAHNVPTATEHYQGMELLKSEMAGVMDADGKEFPNDPHYGESQDATDMATAWKYGKR